MDRGASLRLFVLSLCIPALANTPSRSSAGGTGVSLPGDASVSSTETITALHFNAYKVLPNLSIRANRDLEFLWSDNYRTLFSRPLDGYYGGSTQTDLDRFGLTICEQNSNPFGFARTDIRLAYDYLNHPSSLRGTRFSLYISSPDSLVGYIVNQPDSVNLVDDRKHVDTYIYVPPFQNDPGFGSFVGDDSTGNGQTPSVFLDDQTEDLSTGHTGSAVLHGNSIMIPGPRPSQVGDLNDATRWTGADQLQNWNFDHEFQHVVNYSVTHTGSPEDELASLCAEAIDGERLAPPRFDVPYTRNIILQTNIPGGSNYQAWRSLAAYLVYQFRGIDTTSATLSDDLIWRWSKASTHDLVDLASRLASPECGECDLASKSYLNGLSGSERFHRVLHNWRIAQYVDRFNLAQGQYGFPPQFGFDPIRDVGNWKNNDPVAPDSVVIPNEATVTLAQVERDLSVAGPVGGAKVHSLSMERFGSDYWVLRSDPGLASADRNLVVRVIPEGTCSGVRVTVSAATYNNQPAAGDSLWKHPEWATGVVGPVGLDLPAAGWGVAELVVPNFGLTNKAALVVITTSQLTESVDPGRVIPYRLNVGLRTGTYMTPNPVVSFRDGTFLNLPAWSPQGDSLVFTRNVTPGGTFGELRVKAVTQSGSRMLVSPPQAHSQAYATWSPRGDWVAFAQESTSTNCDVLLYNTVTGELRRLASSQDHENFPAFSPNGQQLVYWRYLSGGPSWQLRRVNLDGTGDVVLLTRSSSFFSPRWSPDGQYIYFNSGTTLYAVSSNGGAEINKGQLIPSASNFDLPSGNGRIVAEDSWAPPNCGGIGQTVSRIVARDTTVGESEVLFYGPGLNPHSPRWSFDNTRAAFLVDSSGNDDIRVSQIGYNHPPHLTNASDALIQEHTPVNFWLSATDADGEPLTFEAVYLPPGASLSSSGLLTWPDPTPIGSKYYITYRVKDPSGGVDQKVVLYDVELLAGGCPMVDSRTSTGWQMENSILGRSLTGGEGTDYYRVRGDLAPVGGNYQLRVRENEQELTTLDQTALLAIDHPSGSRTYSIEGRMMLGSRVPAARVLKSDGTDITQLFSGIGQGYWGSPGETLLVDMTSSAPGAFGISQTQDFCLNCSGGGEGDPKQTQIRYDPGADAMRAGSALPASATDQAVLQQTGILYQRPDGNGGWRTVKHYYPREFSDEAYFDSLGSGKVRVVFVGQHHLTFLGRIEPAATTPTPQSLPLRAARHSRLGTVTSALVGADGSTTTLAPGDTVTMGFAATPVPTGEIRDLFLVSRGVYTTVTSPAQLQAAKLPTRFALEQNRPNPFSRTTTIQFELPVATKVKLEIFDLAGRRVKVVSEKSYVAGYYSVDWDRTDESGRGIRPGLYLYRLTAGAFRDQKKMTLLP